MTAFRLEPFVPAHAEALCEAALESVAEVGRWLPWCHEGLRVEDVRAWIDEQVTGREEGTSYEFAIVGEDGRFLGSCGVNHVLREHRLANVGYWARSSQAGRGLVPRAVRRLVTWAFAETELERLEVLCSVENLRSQRAAVKAGARREGILRRRLRIHDRSHDTVVYSFVRSDL